MGSRNADDRFVSRSEAAKILDRCPRTILRYIDKGWLVTAHNGRTIGTTKESVFALKQKLDDDLSPQAARIQLLESRLLVAESRINAMMKLLNLRNDPLRLTDPEMASLVAMVEYSSKEGWPPQNEEMLVETFMRMGEEDLYQIERLTGDAHPWRSFLLLAGTMRTAIYNHTLQTDAELAAAHVTVLAQMWCKLKGETAKAYDLLMARDATPLKKLVARLERERLKTRTPGEA
jgi:hypothetical protein